VSAAAPRTRPRNLRAAAGGGLLVLLAAYAALVYYGVGPAPHGGEVPWWQPRGFLHGGFPVARFDGRPGGGVAVLVLPALAGAIGVWALWRASLARTAALACVAATALFAYYGLSSRGPAIWSFFGWQGSAVMLTTAVVAAAAAAAPWLAASWLRLGWALRVAVYLPVALAVVATLRGVTGTNPSLAFGVSPWPAVVLFALEGAAATAAGVLACVALALAGGRLREHSPALAAGGFGAAVVVPTGWVALDLGGGLELLAASIGVAVLALRAATAATGSLTLGLRSPAGYAGVGALLVAAPLLTGKVWSHWDYAVSRDERAAEIIAALETYAEEEGGYPERLRELVKAGYLERVPEPRMGFAFFDRPRFTYQSFGTDYLLEFAAPGWTQCAYSPPWEEEIEEGEAAGESLPGSWTCPSEPPELW